MIKKLRIKFVCINMTIVTIMLFIIFGTVLKFTKINLEKESLRMMQSVAMDPIQLASPIKGDAKIRLPYFTLQLGSDGEIQAYGGSYYDLTNRDLLEELISLSSNQKTGVLSDYHLRYIRVVTPTAQRIVFADMTSELNTIDHLIQNCLFIGMFSFLIFLIISILLAQWAVKPVETAWEQQRRFVADASHELKTPLTVILSNAQMLAGNDDDPQLRERLTGNILTVSEQMKDLVSKLLNAARVDHGLSEIQFSDFNLSDAVSDSLLPFDSVFYERELKLTSSIDDNIYIRGSRQHIVQVVDILLDNAQKYSITGGRVCVTLRSNHKRKCIMAVSNEGNTMTAQELKQIFKRFYRADSARERTGSYGLGLSIAEEIVKAHHGKIWAESKDGINTFFVQLPEKKHKLYEQEQTV